MSFVLRRGIKVFLTGLFGHRTGYCFSAKPKRDQSKFNFQPIRETDFEDRSFLARIRKQTGLNMEESISSLQKEPIKDHLNKSKNLMPFLISQENINHVRAADASSAPSSTSTSITSSE